MNVLIISFDDIFSEGIKSNLTKIADHFNFKVVNEISISTKIDFAVSPLLIVVDTRCYCFIDPNNIELLKTTFDQAKFIICCDSVHNQKFLNFYLQNFNAYFLAPVKTEQLLEGYNHVRLNKKYIHQKLTRVIATDLFDKLLRGNKGTPIIFTNLEKQLMQCVFEEMPNKQISICLGISIKTVEAHKTELYRKTGTRTSVGLFKYSLKNNMVGLFDSSEGV